MFISARWASTGLEREFAGNEDAPRCRGVTVHGAVYDGLLIPVYPYVAVHHVPFRQSMALLPRLRCVAKPEPPGGSAILIITTERKNVISVQIVGFI